MGHSPVCLPAATPSAQASSDDGMVALWLRSFSRSANTRAAYGTDIGAFRAAVRMPLAEVTVRDLQGFAETLAGLAPATQSRRLSAVKSLIRMAHRVGYLAFDVGAPVQLPAIQDRLAEHLLTEAQVQRLFFVERNGRDGTLVRLVYGAGLRVSEACGLRWRDLAERDNAGQVTVFGKGGKTRAILLPEALWQRVIKLRGNRGDDDAVFRSRKGGFIGRRHVLTIMKRSMKRAGLPIKFSTHDLRHSHCSHALDRNCPVHVVQTTLGHASLTTTTRYSHARPGDSSAKYLAS